MSRGLKFIVGGLIVCVALPVFAAEHTKDTPETVRKNIEEKKAVLVDVREKAEWDKGHIVGATLLPLSALDAEVPDEKLLDVLPKDKIIYVHCASGRRVIPAYEILTKKGFDVRPLKLGYQDLLKHGFKKDEKKPKP